MGKMKLIPIVLLLALAQASNLDDLDELEFYKKEIKKEYLYNFGDVLLYKKLPDILILTLKVNPKNLVVIKFKKNIENVVYLQGKIKLKTNNNVLLLELMPNIPFATIFVRFEDGSVKVVRVENSKVFDKKGVLVFEVERKGKVDISEIIKKIEKGEKEFEIKGHKYKVVDTDDYDFIVVYKEKIYKVKEVKW